MSDRVALLQSLRIGSEPSFFQRLPTELFSLMLDLVSEQLATSSTEPQRVAVFPQHNEYSDGNAIAVDETHGLVIIGRKQHLHALELATGHETACATPPVSRKEWPHTQKLVALATPELLLSTDGKRRLYLWSPAPLKALNRYYYHDNQHFPHSCLALAHRRVYFVQTKQKSQGPPYVSLMRIKSILRALSSRKSNLKLRHFTDLHGCQANHSVCVASCREFLAVSLGSKSASAEDVVDVSFAAEITAIAVRQDLLVVATQDGEPLVQLVDPRSGTVQGVLSRGLPDVIALTLPSGCAVVALSKTGRVAIWNRQHQRLMRPLLRVDEGARTPRSDLLSSTTKFLIINRALITIAKLDLDDSVIVDK